MWAVITNYYNREVTIKPEAIAYFYEEADALDYAEYLMTLNYCAQVSYVRELHFID